MSALSGRLDHLVWACPDLERGIATLAELTGVTPVAGGAHPGMGSRNALLGLDEGAYLEIIGPDLEQPAARAPRPFGLDGLAEPRLMAWAASEDDLERRVEGALGSGYDPGEIHRMTRLTPSGELLEWRLTRSSERAGPFAQVVPFLISWGRTRHPSSRLACECRLVGLRIWHPEPQLIGRRLASLSLDLEVLPALEARLEASLETPAGLVVLD